MVTLAMADSDIPSISGGKATWIVESAGGGCGGSEGGGEDAALLPIVVSHNNGQT